MKKGKKANILKTRIEGSPILHDHSGSKDRSAGSKISYLH